MTHAAWLGLALVCTLAAGLLLAVHFGVLFVPARAPRQSLAPRAAPRALPRAPPKKKTPDAYPPHYYYYHYRQPRRWIAAGHDHEAE